MKQNEYVGQVSTIMILLKCRDGALLSYFKKIKETELELLINHYYKYQKTMKWMHTKGNKMCFTIGKIFRILYDILKITKKLGFHITFKSTD